MKTVIFFLFVSLTSVAQNNIDTVHIDKNDFGKYYYVMKEGGDTLQFEVIYFYNDPSSIDEEYAETIRVMFLNNRKPQKGFTYSFPSINIVGERDYWSADSYPPVRSIDGTIQIIAISKDKAEAKIQLNGWFQIPDGPILFQTEKK